MPRRSTSGGIALLGLIASRCAELEARAARVHGASTRSECFGRAERDESSGVAIPFVYFFNRAGVAKLVDARRLGRRSSGNVGSSPTARTKRGG